MKIQTKTVYLLSVLFLPLIVTTPSHSQDPDRVPVDEIIVSQGYGGNLMDVHLINVDRRVRFPGNPYQQLLRVLNVFQSMSKEVHAKLGGGRDRTTYLTTGDVNQDGELDVITTFGPITNFATYPNMVIVRNPKTKAVVGHPFQAFPADKPKSEINYTVGELHTAFGDFIRSGKPQIAVAQGYGGAGYVRLFEYTGKPAPYGWRVVGQFLGLQDLEPNLAYTENANRGVTLAAGDLDGDGVDELVVGQTGSDTSMSIFQVLDIRETRGEGVADVIRRIEGIAFPGVLSGEGGVELAVADFNGDSVQELIAGTQGNRQNHRDWRDFMAGNSIAVFCPIVEDQKVIGLQRPNYHPLIKVFHTYHNPSGAIQITAGEFDGVNNGKEFAATTGALFSYAGTNVTTTLPAPDALFKVYKMNLYYSPEWQIVYDFTNIDGIYYYNQPHGGHPIYHDLLDPSSGAASISSGNIY